MTNAFNSGAILSPNGWIAFYRDVRWSANKVLRDGKHDIIFASQQEAKDAGHAALLAHLNGNMVCEFMTAAPVSKRQAKFAEAERKLFRGGGKVIAVQRLGDAR
jgi:hypothetical protein